MVIKQEPKPGSLWIHLKTASVYLVLDVATCSTNGEREDRERSVLYFSFSRRHWRYRELSEFMDGRFVELTGTPTIPGSLIA